MRANTEPEIVLFGLILFNFGPPISFPKIKPPMSDAIQPSKIEIKIIFKNSAFENIKNKTQKKKI